MISNQHGFPSILGTMQTGYVFISRKNVYKIQANHPKENHLLLSTSLLLAIITFKNSFSAFITKTHFIGMCTQYTKLPIWTTVPVQVFCPQIQKSP